MASHYRHRRTSTAATPFPTPVEPGEIVANTANRQLVIGDAASGTLGQPLALLAVRFFDARAQYAVGDFVVQAGALYRANTAIVPAAFNPSQWDAISSADVNKAYVDAGDAAVTTAFQNADASLAASTQAGFDAQTTAVAAKAPIASPTFTGDPKAPTPAPGDNDTSIATTAFVAAAAAASVTGKVDKAGDTMTGNLAINKASAALTLSKTAAGQEVAISGQLNGLSRWAIAFGDAAAESGGNAGSDFRLYRFTDAGAYLGSPLVVTRSNGLLVLEADPTAPLGVATKHYVDTYAAPFDALAYNGLQFNGAMEVSQERAQGTGVTVNNVYVCDGWVFGISGTGIAYSASSQRQNTFPGFTSLFITQVTTAKGSLAASDYAALTQAIEGYRVSRLAWGTSSAQPVTIGFWTAHNRAGTYSIVLQNSDASRSIAVTYQQIAANTPEYHTVTIPGCTDGVWKTDNGIGIYLNFSMAAGTSVIAPSANTWLTGGFYVAAPGQVNAVAATTDVFRITGVTVLPGIEAPSAARSAFIMRPYDEELRLSKRYYQKLGGAGISLLLGGYASAYVEQTLVLPVEMRAAPTVSAFGSWTNANVAATQYFPGTTQIGWQLTATAVGYCQSYNGANSGIIADARL